MGPGRLRLPKVRGDIFSLSGRLIDAAEIFRNCGISLLKVAKLTLLCIMQTIFRFQRPRALIFAKQELTMKKSMVTLLAGISMAALLIGGCASKETVKKDEGVVPVVTAEKVAEAKTMAQPIIVEQAKPAAKAAEAAEAAEAMMVAAPQASNSVATEMNLAAVYFDFDKADLRQDSRDVLSKNAETILKSLAKAKIQIEGHCDERGSAEYNMALGERRAKSAQKYLTTLGVNANNLSVISYGKEKPAVVGNDEAAWAKNRRAEFSVTK
jgi:peptidoglycan-associated lipoprotein